MKEIVVGVDGSAASEAAARWAAELAMRVDAEVAVTSAWVPEQAEVPPDRYDELRREAATQVEVEWTRPVRGVAPRWHAALAESADPAEGLLDIATADRAEVIVIGGADEEGTLGFHVGSVAAELARHTKRPLALVPPSAPTPIREIVLGVDGSPASAACVDYCSELARALGARTVAVLAREPLAERLPFVDPGPWRDEALDELRGWTAPLTASGVPTEQLVVETPDPVDALVAEARALEADLVMVGTHPRSEVTGMRLPGVGIDLLGRVRCPVLIVPAEVGS